MAEKKLTPSEQASKLFLEYYTAIPAEMVRYINISDLAKKLALIAVNKIIDELKEIYGWALTDKEHPYWKEVKEELQKI